MNKFLTSLSKKNFNFYNKSFFLKNNNFKKNFSTEQNISFKNINKIIITDINFKKIIINNDDKSNEMPLEIFDKKMLIRDIEILYNQKNLDKLKIDKFFDNNISNTRFFLKHSISICWFIIFLYTYKCFIIK